jgi:quinol monooxygenase YgiN
MPMAYATVHTLEGDPEELLARKEKYFDPIVSRIAPEYGGIASVTARTETGLLIVNVWEDADRVAAFTAHPEVKAAQAAAKLPMPTSFERYEEAACEVFLR